MLQVHHITHQIGRKKLLDDVSLTAKPGELVAVVGANGAGKSTLLKTISRDIVPATGHITLNGTPLPQFSATELARQRAVLTQHNTLTFNFRVYELVMMGRYPHFEGSPRADDLAVIDYALTVTGITHLVDRYVPTLSGGEQQRTYLAKVLSQLVTADEISHKAAVPSISSPKYLLLDEPTTGLDLYYQHTLLDIAKDMTTRGYGVIAILHDLNLVMQYADKVILLKEGKSIAFGQPATVLTPETIKSAFGLTVNIICQPGFECPVIVHTRRNSAFVTSSKTT